MKRSIYLWSYVGKSYWKYLKYDIYFSVRCAGTKSCVPMSSLKLKSFISGITRNAPLSPKLEPRYTSKIPDLSLKDATLKETIWQESWISLSLLGTAPNEVQKKGIHLFRSQLSQKAFYRNRRGCSVRMRTWIIIVRGLTGCQEQGHNGKVTAA